MEIRILMSACVLALFSSFLLLFLIKVGVVQELRHVMENKPKNKVGRFFRGLSNCYFCMSFWTNIIVCTVFCLVSGEYSAILFLPILSTPLTRIML